MKARATFCHGVMAFIVIASLASAAEPKLKVGDTFPNWRLKNGDDQTFSLDNFPGMITLINYTSPNAPSLNEHVNQALHQAVLNGRLSVDSYRGMGVVNCACTWKPNSLIRAFAERKRNVYKASKTPILYDYDRVLEKAVGLPKGEESFIAILDKDRKIQAFYIGKVKDAAAVVKFVEQLQNASNDNSNSNSNVNSKVNANSNSNDNSNSRKPQPCPSP